MIRVPSTPIFPQNLNHPQSPPTSPRADAEPTLQRADSPPILPPNPNPEQSPPNSPLGPNGGGSGRARAG